MTPPREDSLIAYCLIENYNINSGTADYTMESNLIWVSNTWSMVVKTDKPLLQERPKWEPATQCVIFCNILTFFMEMTESETVPIFYQMIMYIKSKFNVNQKMSNVCPTQLINLSQQMPKKKHPPERSNMPETEMVSKK